MAPASRAIWNSRTHSAASPWTPTLKGLPKYPGRDTTTVFSGFRQPFLRDNCIRCGTISLKFKRSPRFDGDNVPCRLELLTGCGDSKSVHCPSLDYSGKLNCSTLPNLILTLRPPQGERLIRGAISTAIPFRSVQTSIVSDA